MKLIRYSLGVSAVALLASMTAANAQTVSSICVKNAAGNCTQVSVTNPFPVTGAGGGGGTSSNFNVAFPTAGTAAGFLDSTGTNMLPANLDAAGNIKVLTTQTGTWNITNITGTISLPTG